MNTLETHVADTEAARARILPTTPFQILTTTPGWARAELEQRAALLDGASRLILLSTRRPADSYTLGVSPAAR